MAYNNRAALWADLGKLKKSLNDYDMALELDSTNPLFYTNRGLTYQRWGQYHRALDDYSRALELDDGDTQALTAKAWVLATCPLAKLRNGPQAVDLASRAVVISRDPQHPGHPGRGPGREQEVRGCGAHPAAGPGHPARVRGRGRGGAPGHGATPQALCQKEALSRAHAPQKAPGQKVAPGPASDEPPRRKQRGVKRTRIF